MRVQIEPFNVIATGVFFWRFSTRSRRRASLVSHTGCNTVTMSRHAQ